MKRKLATITVTFACAMACMTSCNTETDPSTNHADVHIQDDGHGHSHGDAPHGGTIADWGGGKYHVEFTVDHDLQQATVYILGGDAKSAAPVKADEITFAITDPQFQVVLKASPMDGESDGLASRFIGNHEQLGTVTEFAGKIYGTVEGTPFSGNFNEVPHDH